MKTLFISDLDGTLLTSRETISEYSMQKLNSLIDGRGVCFTYATARSLNSAAKACWGLRQNLPVILYNGALIMDPSTRKMLYNNHFTREQLAYIRALFDSFQVWPLVYYFRDGIERVSWQEGTETPGVMRYLDRRRGDSRLYPVDSADRIEGADIFYFTCIGKKEELDGLRDAVEANPQLKCIYQQETYQTDYWCEIMPKDTSKGTAARELKRMLGAEKLVVFGDAVNDTELFLAADERYAVQNAEESLKKLATRVIGFCEEDAVAKFIEENVGAYV
ncbi:MAG TPA: Cof-type HAD-IIB family hydrolase [Candidatus Borkfalkia faecavium]|uniref:Cof-type HAD-IIB family hydrolase n=1 Tax=Candidatus Borkfalkia faecavium TaxID=2838508 RepID=A0A9D2AU17_9FIRM|nr:Cof-type HAD-IIB family hydrolase [Candidatus Borkfalkia faecavium]